MSNTKPLTEAQVIAKLKALCDEVIEFDTQADIYFREAATTDDSADARKFALYAREQALAAFGVYLEAASLYAGLSDADVVKPLTVRAIVDDVVGEMDESEEEESEVDTLLSGIRWYSNNSLKSAKKADNACIRLKHVYWQPSAA